ncbi:uncharacterized protein ms(3)76Ba [Drosophila takahashii]|uniref:uncharacterized protein ms(3)76Ba n=1 Tax=Drosophila takahashii TaxID=29030 RepID=UPI003898F21E
MNLSDSDSDVDDEFIKHLFSDDMLKKLELEERNQGNKKTRKEEPSTSHEYMDRKRGKRKITETARSRQKTPRNILARKERDSLPLEEPEANFSTQTDTFSRPPLSCGPTLKPLPTKFCNGDVVLDFGFEESSEPMHVISDVTPVPASNASRKVKTGRLHSKYKEKESAKSSKIVQKSPVDKEPPPDVEPEILIDQNFRPITPIKMNLMDEYNVDLPSSEDIWKSYMDLKKGLVPASEAEWPLCCMVSQIRPKTPPPKVVECLTPMETPSKIVESQEKNPAEGLIYWDMDGKFNNDTQQNRNFHNEDIVFDHMTIGAEEERAIKDWIKSEKLNEPFSDIEEFDMLLSLARDSEKNRDILVELLKPNNFLTAQEKQVQKRMHPVAFEKVPRKIDGMEPQPRKPVHDEIKPVSEKEIPVINVVDPFKDVSLNELRPERPIILEVKDFGSVPPKPQDETASQDWLQLCSDTVSQQYQFIFNEECSKPASTELGPIDFENELNKDLMKPRNCQRMTSTESGWQTSFTVRLEDFEAILDQNMREYKDPHAKVLRSKWNQKYGSKSSENLTRILPLPPLPVHLDQCLQKIRILRRPSKRNVECLRLRIVMNYCKMFCTLQMKKNLNLQIAARSLDNAVYNSVRDVIEVRYEATQIGWIWSNGTVMIINGRSNAMLSETQRDIVAKILGKLNFKAEPSHNLLHLRLSSVAYYPWRVSLPEFSGTCALSPEPFLSEMQFVYYVDKELPGVSARLHESGMVKVFAMNTAEADKMLTKLYLLTANHRKADNKVIKNEPN